MSRKGPEPSTLHTYTRFKASGCGFNLKARHSDEPNEPSIPQLQKPSRVTVGSLEHQNPKL